MNAINGRLPNIWVIHVLDTNFFQQIKELFQHKYDDLCKRPYTFENTNFEMEFGAQGKRILALTCA